MAKEENQEFDPRPNLSLDGKTDLPSAIINAKAGRKQGRERHRQAVEEMRQEKKAARANDRALKKQGKVLRSARAAQESQRPTSLMSYLRGGRGRGG
ncbi:hypothetical protein DEF23_22935 [Marinitenerispora sediminis]|uniref:Uncharacterized protein n=2 Tax=Marinitenerispora sediminis TaxID=1931232 RepID=A0A368T0Q3_9ACTN|nr:hypothetical protein DEF28_23625 [Marinitenerispora sediminis]RCV49910.1 hypothetical protein DEF23_22935 [Marinitenerispora sediminis]RCV52822.1 hypothetical protein DEF24_21460 [Marinitenerispora sediminis]